MEQRDLELIERYIDEDQELKKYVCEHQEFERKIEELNRRVFLTPEEEYERKRLQKLKLAGRDQIERILSRYRKQAV
jgi:uncharacterized protein YdcH (DUF465 family)